MPPCDKCRSSTFLDTTLCKEHYYELYNIEPEFHKYKEKQWRDYLTHHLLSSWDILPVYNKQLPGSTVIPDLHFVLTIHSSESILFLIEIDEYQHKLGLNYSSAREQTRYSQLGTYSRVHVFRVNPDSTKTSSAIFHKKTHIVSPGVLKDIIHTNDDEFERRKTIVSRKINQVLKEEVLHKKTSCNYPLFTLVLQWFYWVLGWWFNTETTEVKVYKMFYD